MTLLSLFAFTVFFVAQMWLDILVPRCIWRWRFCRSMTLIIYLWGPEKLKARGLKVLYRVMYASSVLVIPCLRVYLSRAGVPVPRPDTGQH